MSGERFPQKLLVGTKVAPFGVAILLAVVSVSNLLGQGGGAPFVTPPVQTPPLTPGSPPSSTPPVQTPPVPGLSSPQSTSQTSPAGGAGDYIVTFRAGTSRADRAASVQRAGAALRFNYTIVDAVAVTIPNANAFAALQRDPSVLEIIPDREVEAFQSAQVTPAGVARVGTPTGTSNGAGIGVAIGDTGIDLAHADLAGAVASQFFSAYGSNCQDKNGHGTHVAGIVGARNNTIDVVGVAPNSTLYCAQVLNDRGKGSDSALMAGLDWVAKNDPSVTPPIRVVNLSLGRTGTLDDNTALRGSVQALYNAGIVVVAAAGNDASKEVSQMVPAGYPEVLAVGSTSAVDGSNAGCSFFTQTIQADTASYFTTDGAFNTTTRIGLTISAPGEEKENVTKSCFASTVGILSLKLGGGTTRKSGTSMAAPLVAGIVARMIQASGFSASSSGVENIRSNLRNTADRKTIAPLDSPTSGYSYDGEKEGIAKAP